jgi:hypothetical protein
MPFSKVLQYSLTLAIVPSLSKQQMTVVLPSDSSKLVDLVKDSRSHLVNKDKNLSQTASKKKKKKKKNLLKRFDHISNEL